MNGGGQMLQFRLGSLSQVSWRIVVLLLAWGTPVAAATIRVPGDFPSIQEAVAASSVGDTVLVGPGTYLETVTIDHYLTLLSEKGAASTIIDAQGQGAVVSIAIAAAGSVVEGFRITEGDGTADISAGGIHVEADSGDGWAVIRKNIIDHNFATFHPSGLDAPVASVVEDNIIEDNVGVKSPAIRADGTVRRNIIRRNVSVVVIAELRGTVENNLIVENLDSNAHVWAGGVFRNNTVANNGRGSAVRVGFDIQELSNNLITYTREQGIGLLCEESVQNSQNVRCNDVWGPGDSYYGACDQMEGVDGNVSLDPQFCAVGDRPDYLLLPSSPCAPENSPPGCGLIGAFEVCEIARQSPVESPPREIQLLIDPNPIRSVATLALKGEVSPTMIDIVDAQGRVVDRLVPGHDREIRWTPAEELATGVYFARVQAPQGSSVTKFIIVR